MAQALKRHVGFRYTRNGGMRFLRIGRVQLSWCLCKRRLNAV